MCMLYARLGNICQYVHLYTIAAGVGKTCFMIPLIAALHAVVVATFWGAKKEKEGQFVRTKPSP